MDEQDLVECIYCGCEVHEIDPVPRGGDDDAWAEIEADGEHDESCEWVRTRAHQAMPADPE
jgi:hypothetical protein